MPRALASFHAFELAVPSQFPTYDNVLSEGLGVLEEWQTVIEGTPASFVQGDMNLADTIEIPPVDPALYHAHLTQLSTDTTSHIGADVQNVPSYQVGERPGSGSNMIQHSVVQEHWEVPEYIVFDDGWSKGSPRRKTASDLATEGRKQAAVEEPSLEHQRGSLSDPYIYSLLHFRSQLLPDI
ncbi:hypothetical protein NOR_01567 [Metarhizium rileyi]|uniref:Uncharacterized protein n=1 Tax=Metarhizium rileyi (strain RCEF 4871) TaxID=1649241 RepID=A0A162KDS6_METRR|nr:hypothetical protein NOR_01567 [Metarhizium rileyi RCEF 4871]